MSETKRQFRKYEDTLRERLADPEYARVFLDVALEEYEKDGYGGVFVGTERCGRGKRRSRETRQSNSPQPTKPLSSPLRGGQPTTGDSRSHPSRAWFSIVSRTPSI